MISMHTVTITNLGVTFLILRLLVLNDFNANGNDYKSRSHLFDTASAVLNDFNAHGNDYKPRIYLFDTASACFE
jgi:hypothetical protein